MIIRGTYWRAITEPKGKRFATTSEKLVVRFRTPTATTDKMKLWGWSPTTFAGDYRKLESVEYSYAIGLDLEKDGTNFHAAVDAFSDFAGFVHSTYSHNPDAHRLRAIFFLTRPVSPAEYRRVRRHLAAIAKRAGQGVDDRAHDPSRLWFGPGIAPGGEYLFAELEGALVDVDAVLAREPDESTHAPAPPYVPLPTTTTIVDRARHYLKKCSPAISGSGGHTTTFLVAQKMVRGFGLDPETAYALLSEWNQFNQPPWSERDLRRKVREAMRAGRMPVGALAEAPRRAS